MVARGGEEATGACEIGGFHKTGSGTLTRLDPADEPALSAGLSAAGAEFPARVFASAETAGEEGSVAGRSSADLTPQPTTARARMPSIAKREVCMTIAGGTTAVSSDFLVMG